MGFRLSGWQVKTKDIPKWKTCCLMQAPPLRISNTKIHLVNRDRERDHLCFEKPSCSKHRKQGNDRFRSRLHFDLFFHPIQYDYVISTSFSFSVMDLHDNQCLLHQRLKWQVSSVSSSHVVSSQDEDQGSPSSFSFFQLLSIFFGIRIMLDSCWLFCVGYRFFFWTLASSNWSTSSW